MRTLLARPFGWGFAYACPGGRPVALQRYVQSDAVFWQAAGRGHPRSTVDYAHSCSQAAKIYSPGVQRAACGSIWRLLYFEANRMDDTYMHYRQTGACGVPHSFFFLPRRGHLVTEATSAPSNRTQVFFQFFSQFSAEFSGITPLVQTSHCVPPHTDPRTPQ